VSIGPLEKLNDETALGEVSGTMTNRPPSIWFNLMYLLSFIPKNIVSFGTGFLVRIKFPKILQTYVNKGFVKLFGIDMTEAALPMAEFACLEDLFIRELRENSRKISGRYVSSADGRVEISRSMTGDGAIQAKGLTYKLGELIFGARADQLSQSSELAAAWYTTVYLAPHNYHRVHAPFAGTLRRLRHIPGELWPVNRMAVSLVPRLFVRNERLVFEFELEQGAKAWLVMVGALNVGRMSTTLCPGFVTNSFARLLSAKGSARELLTPNGGVAISAGDELGVFMLGSTTVVVLDAKAASLLNPREILVPEPVTMGQSLSVQ
jgi:phosphatidylserine decarboxylase